MKTREDILSELHTSYRFHSSGRARSFYASSYVLGRLDLRGLDEISVDRLLQEANSFLENIGPPELREQDVIDFFLELASFTDPFLTMVRLFWSGCLLAEE